MSNTEHKTRKQRSRKRLANVARMLRHFKLQPEGVERPTNYYALAMAYGDQYLLNVAGVKFLLWDNGGELGLERINSDEYDMFVPCEFRANANPNDATVASWIAQRLRGEQLDVQDRLTDEDEAILLSLG